MISRRMFLATGGAELPAQIRVFYADLATEAPTEAAAARLRARGEQEAGRIAAEVRAAFAEATRRIYWMTALIMVVGCALSLRIPELPLRTTHDRVVARDRAKDPL